MKIPASLPSFSQDDIDFIIDNFKDILEGKSFLSQYKFSEIFENNFSKFIGCPQYLAREIRESLMPFII